MVLSFILGKKNLGDWTHVILDEVHEREEDMDFVVLLCKKLQRENSRGVKIILMSATMDAQKFREYFSSYVAHGKLEGFH
jgi:ATP-dependent RNA helicase TDRD9